jgi:HD-like signal output (HDOD) protein
MNQTIRVQSPPPPQKKGGADKTAQMIATIRDDLRFNRLFLPALPEVAIRLRKTVDEPGASAAQIAKAISADPAISARLLQVANAALYRGRQPVDSIQGAIARLGVDMVRNLVFTLVMEQLYKCKTSGKTKQMQITIWKHSVSVAALSGVIAAKFTTLGKDEAMLGGLVHDIGTLPILVRAATIPELDNNEALLQTVLDEMHAEVGTLIVETWSFPESLRRCVTSHECYDEVTSADIDICDIVALADLCSHPADERNELIADFDSLPALRKLGLDGSAVLSVINDAQAEIREIEQLLLH